MLSACAAYQATILDPWVGATKAELVEGWGYPTSNDDIVKIDDTITVYSYRSKIDIGFDAGPQDCVVSFTLERDIVTSARYVGANCIRHERQ